jgi:PAS domain S-box-containing protein
MDNFAFRWWCRPQHLEELMIELNAVTKETAKGVNRDGRLSSVIRAEKIAMIAFDDWGMIELFNYSAEILFGYSANELYGRDVRTLVENRKSDGRENCYRRRLESFEISRKSIFRSEIGLRKDGSTFAVYTCQSKERFGEGRFRIAFFLPIKTRELLPNIIFYLHVEKILRQLQPARLSR